MRQQPEFVYNHCMKVMLINPPFYKLKGIDFTNLPLGIAYLAGYIRKDHNVVIYNTELVSEGEKSYVLTINNTQRQEMLENILNDPNHIIWKNIKDTITKFNPDVVGLSVMTCKYTQSLIITRIAKSINPGVKIIWGGPHATAAPAAILQDNDNIDFVAVREGEAVLQKLIQHFEGALPLTEIGSIYYKEEGKIVSNPPEPYIPELDNIPFPAKDLEINKHLLTTEHLNNILSSRGCPWNCTYCDSKNTWSRKIRYRSVDNIMLEIDELVNKYGVTSLGFIDDTFTVNSKRTIDFCQRLIKGNYNLSWTCTTRLDVLTEDVVKNMKESGVSVVTVGIESGSERILKLTDKRMTKDAIRQGVKLLNKYRIDWHAFFMVGFPYETQQDIQDSKDFIHELKPTTVELSIFTPYPGTQLYTQARDMGLIPPNMEWSKFSHQSFENHFVESIPKERFREIIREFFEEMEHYNNSWRNVFKKALLRRGALMKDPMGALKSIKNVLTRKFK